MTWENFMTLFVDEFGCTNVKDITHYNGKWLVKYKKTEDGSIFPYDEFDLLSDLIEYFKTE